MSTNALAYHEMRKPDGVADMIGMLVGKKIRVKKGEPFRLGRDPAYIGVYRRDDATVGGVMICDVAFGAYTGCALSLIPPRDANAAVKAGVLPDHIIENFREIVNVSSRLYSTARCPRVIFSDLMAYPVRLPKDILHAMVKPRERLDYAVNIPGYGDAKFAVLIS